MKTLYLHCGYHKTGSSFLQMLFARNRVTLRENGIYFPASEREYDMIKGNISPGNGPKLAAAIKDGKEKKTTELLERWFEEAEKQNCERLLLSSEELFHAFEKKNALDCLLKACKELAIEHISALVYFRDPVSHAISTYKHRAKNGNIKEIAGWLENGYETMKLLKSFTEYRLKYPIEWNCRKYRADSMFMAESAFVDWLKISLPAIPDDDMVNVSLTFSEIQAIQSLQNEYPNITDYLKREFKKLTRKEKAPDDHLFVAHKNIAISKLQVYQELINKVNKSLNEHEHLALPELEVQTFELKGSEMVLSEKQLLAIGRAINKAREADRIKGKIQALSQKVRNRVNRLLIRT